MACGVAACRLGGVVLGFCMGLGRGQRTYHGSNQLHKALTIGIRIRGLFAIEETKVPSEKARSLQKSPLRGLPTITT